MSDDRKQWLADLAASAVMTTADFTPYHHGGSPTSRRKPPPPDRPCDNCDTVFQPRSSTGRYCGKACQQTVKAVRYARGAIARHGQPRPTDINFAVGIKIAHVLVGGYAEQNRRLPPDVRAAVIARDQGRCTLCQRPGEEIDHIAGDSADPNHLRLLCRPCHRKITQQHLRRIPDGHSALRLHTDLLARIYAPTPLRPCDAENWAQTWRVAANGSLTADTDRR